MLKRCVLFGIGVFLIGCAHHAHHANHAPRTHKAAETKTPGIKTQQSRSVGQFSKIEAEGSINLHLHTGYKKPMVILRGDSKDLAQVHTTVKHDTLYLIVGKGYPQFGPIHADIQGYKLSRLRYRGAGSIRGNQLHSQGLDLIITNGGTTQLGGDIMLNKLQVTNSGPVHISGVRSPRLQATIKGNSRVELQGVVYICKLNMDGKASLSLYWLRGASLNIKARSGSTIQLAGVVDKLDVELWGRSRFKGRYLRAKRAFVKTHGRSVAEVLALHHQSSLATDASDIYYYQVPKKTRADFMALSGSSLNMQEWYQYDEHPVTQYNKQIP